MLGISQTFRCPNCNEYIDSDARECRFCGHQVDAESAARAAADQEKINGACNDAQNVRNLAGAMWVMIALRFVPFIGCFTGVASLILFFVTLGLLIRWEVKYAGVRTIDPDFAAAKRNRLIAFIAWVAALLLVVGVFGISFLIGFIQAASQR